MNKFRINLLVSSNKIDLSKHHIDNIIMVRRKDSMLMMPLYGEKFTYNQSTKILEILAEIYFEDEIEITFYSKAESRDKLLNEILN